MSIAHHLYVLKSYGISGAFAEFGCFKGYSSAMLSYACSLLGIRMHIFDSFEGLPPSDSLHYKAGEFRGSINEVQENIRIYGAPDVVEYHKGYFNSSIPACAPTMTDLAIIWMDVDLFSSAVDVMSLSPKLDVRGAIFSHECQSAQFADGKIIAGAQSPDNVVAAIVQRFNARNIAITGRFVSGCTGAFWCKRDGIPVLANSCLMSMLASI
jgi:hypothetical protein